MTKNTCATCKREKEDRWKTCACGSNMVYNYPTPRLLEALRTK